MNSSIGRRVGLVLQAEAMRKAVDARVQNLNNCGTTISLPYRNNKAAEKLMDKKGSKWTIMSRL